MNLFPFIKQEEIKYQNELLTLNHPELEWNYYLYQGFSQTIVIQICKEMINSIFDKEKVIVCSIKEVNDPRLEVLMIELRKRIVTSFPPV